jgi:hypothetical protein
MLSNMLFNHLCKPGGYSLMVEPRKKSNTSPRVRLYSDSAMELGSKGRQASEVDGNMTLGCVEFFSDLN